MAVSTMALFAFSLFILIVGSCSGHSIVHLSHDGFPPAIAISKPAKINIIKQIVLRYSKEDEAGRTGLGLRTAARGTAAKQQMTSEQEDTFSSHRDVKRQLSGSQLSALLQFIHVTQYRKLLKDVATFNSPMFIGK